MIPQNVCQCLCLITIPRRTFHRTCGASQKTILETGSVRKLSHNGCTAANFDLPDHGFLLLTCSTGPMECSTGNSYQAEALTIYMSSFYFWSPWFARKIRKTNMRYYPEYPSRSWHPILHTAGHWFYIIYSNQGAY
jgi:hypothetical protein